MLQRLTVSALKCKVVPRVTAPLQQVLRTSDLPPPPVARFSLRMWVLSNFVLGKEKKKNSKTRQTIELYIIISCFGDPVSHRVIVTQIRRNISRYSAVDATSTAFKEK